LDTRIPSLMTKDLFTLGVESNSTWFTDSTLIPFPLSNSNCLGHVDTKDYNYPVCIEELAGTRCVDVACGEDFTVVLTSLN
jgi:Regulator of chromosome condensation (RCC1) repeat